MIDFIAKCETKQSKIKHDNVSCQVANQKTHKMWKSKRRRSSGSGSSCRTSHPLLIMAKLLLLFTIFLPETLASQTGQALPPNSSTEAIKVNRTQDQNTTIKTQSIDLLEEKQQRGNDRLLNDRKLLPLLASNQIREVDRLQLDPSQTFSRRTLELANESEQHSQGELGLSQQQETSMEQNAIELGNQKGPGSSEVRIKSNILVIKGGGNEQTRDLHPMKRVQALNSRPSELMSLKQLDSPASDSLSSLIGPYRKFASNFAPKPATLGFRVIAGKDQNTRLMMNERGLIMAAKPGRLNKPTKSMSGNNLLQSQMDFSLNPIKTQIHMGPPIVNDLDDPLIQHMNSSLHFDKQQSTSLLTSLTHHERPTFLKRPAVSLANNLWRPTGGELERNNDSSTSSSTGNEISEDLVQLEEDQASRFGSKWVNQITQTNNSQQQHFQHNPPYNKPPVQSTDKQLVSKQANQTQSQSHHKRPQASVTRRPQQHRQQVKESQTGSWPQSSSRITTTTTTTSAPSGSSHINNTTELLAEQSAPSHVQATTSGEQSDKKQPPTTSPGSNKQPMKSAPLRHKLIEYLLINKLGFKQHQFVNVPSQGESISQLQGSANQPTPAPLFSSTVANNVASLFAQNLRRLVLSGPPPAPPPPQFGGNGNGNGASGTGSSQMSPLQSFISNRFSQRVQQSSAAQQQHWGQVNRRSTNVGSILLSGFIYGISMLPALMALSGNNLFSVEASSSKKQSNRLSEEHAVKRHQSSNAVSKKPAIGERKPGAEQHSSDSLDIAYLVPLIAPMQAQPDEEDRMSSSSSNEPSEPGSDRLHPLLDPDDFELTSANSIEGPSNQLDPLADLHIVEPLQRFQRNNPILNPISVQPMAHAWSQEQALKSVGFNQSNSLDFSPNPPEVPLNVGSEPATFTPVVLLPIEETTMGQQEQKLYHHQYDDSRRPQRHLITSAGKQVPIVAEPVKLLPTQVLEAAKPRLAYLSAKWAPKERTSGVKLNKLPDRIPASEVKSNQMNWNRQLNLKNQQIRRLQQEQRLLSESFVPIVPIGRMGPALSSIGNPGTYSKSLHQRRALTSSQLMRQPMQVGRERAKSNFLYSTTIRPKLGAKHREPVESFSSQANSKVLRWSSNANSNLNYIPKVALATDLQRKSLNSIQQVATNSMNGNKQALGIFHGSPSLLTRPLSSSSIEVLQAKQKLAGNQANMRQVGVFRQPQLNSLPMGEGSHVYYKKSRKVKSQQRQLANGNSIPRLAKNSMNVMTIAGSDSSSDSQANWSLPRISSSNSNNSATSVTLKRLRPTLELHQQQQQAEAQQASTITTVRPDAIQMETRITSPPTTNIAQQQQQDQKQSIGLPDPGSAELVMAHSMALGSRVLNEPAKR